MTKFYKLTKQNVCVYNTYYTHCLYLSISNIIKNTTDFDLSLTYTQKEQQIYNARVCLAYSQLLVFI